MPRLGLLLHILYYFTQAHYILFILMFRAEYIIMRYAISVSNVSDSKEVYKRETENSKIGEELTEPDTK